MSAGEKAEFTDFGTVGVLLWENLKIYCLFKEFIFVIKETMF